MGLAAGGVVLAEESSGARSVGGAGLGATTSFCSARMLDESRASGPPAGSLRERILVVMFAWVLRQFVSEIDDLTPDDPARRCEDGEHCNHRD